MPNTNIYILKLQGGRYYVGKSDNPMKRYQEHLNGSGSAWTNKYKPIGVEKIIPKASEFDEDRYVKEYMNKYGIDKVRGGAYVTENLSGFQVAALEIELWGATDKCTNCGRKGHWAKDCFAKTTVNGDTIEEESDESESEDDDVIECYDCHKQFTSDFTFQKHNCKSNYSSGSCYRCGRKGHYASECYAGSHRNGYALNN